MIAAAAGTVARPPPAMPEKAVLKLTALAFALSATLSVIFAATAATAQPVAPAKRSAAPPPRRLGPALWHGARLGAGRDDVAALFPAATASGGEALPGGAKSGLVLATKLGGAPASAQFYFLADSLETIIVDRPDVVPGDTAGNLIKAHGVADELAREYGKPGACDEQRRVAVLICTWTLGEAKAILSYRDVGGAAPRLSVSYRRLNDVKPWAPGPVKRLKPR